MCIFIGFTLRLEPLILVERFRNNMIRYATLGVYLRLNLLRGFGKLGRRGIS